MEVNGKRINVPKCNFEKGDPTAKGHPLPAGKYLGRNGPFDQNSTSRNLSGSEIAVIAPENLSRSAEELKKAFEEGYEWLSPDFSKYFHLRDINVDKRTFEGQEFDDYKRAAKNAADEGFDLAIFIVESEMKNEGPYSPYYAAKFKALDLGLPTQMVTKEIVSDKRDFQNSIVNIAVQAYAKLGGIPWVLNETASDTRFIVGTGTSYESSSSRFGSQKRTVGFTSVFRDDGRFRHYDSTPAMTDYDSVQKELQSRIENSIENVSSVIEEGDEIVIHNYKRIGEAEKKAADNLEQEYGVNVSLLHIDTNSNLEIFDPSNPSGNASSGVVVRTGSNQAILNTDGKETAQRGPASTNPLWIKAHKSRNVNNFEDKVKDIYYLTYVFWKDQFGANEPITTKYSKTIADRLKVAMRLSREGRINMDIENLGENLNDVPWFI